MNYLTLTLPPSWGAEESYDVGSNFESQLGDGYISTSSSVEPRVTWTIQAIDTKDKIENISDFLSNRSGVESFYWSPNVEVLPLQLYFCTEWSITPIGFDTFSFSATFIKDIESPCSDLSDLIDITKIKSDITASKVFIDNVSTIDVNNLIINNSTPKEGNTWLHVFYTFATEAYSDFFKIQVVEPDGIKKDVLIKSGAGSGAVSNSLVFGTGTPNPWTSFSYAFQKKGKYKIRFLHEKDSGFSVQNEVVAIDSVVIGNSSTRAGITTTYLNQDFESGTIPSGWINNWWQITQSPVYSGTKAIKSSLTDDDRNATASLEFEFEIFPQPNLQSLLMISDANLVTKLCHQDNNVEIPWQAGTLYDQINLSMAFLNVYKLLDDQTWLDKSLLLAEAIETYYYNGNSTLPHWLINVRSPIGSIQNNQLFEIYSPNGGYTAFPPSVTTLATNQVNVRASWLPMLWELYDELYSITQNVVWQTRSNKIKTGFQSIINYSPNTINSELFTFSITRQNNTVTSRYGDRYLISQNLWGLVDNNTEQLLAAIDNLTKAQIKYAEINDEFGPFAFRISPIDSKWHLNTATGEISSTGSIINVFIVNPMIEGSDSGFSQAQFGLWLAKALYYSNTRFDSLQKLLMDWLNWIDGIWCSIEPDFPPVRFSENNLPYPDSDPATQALIGESALWANINGEDPGTTFRLILRTYEYLEEQFEINVASVMYGSWSKDSETYIGETLKNYDSRTHSCVINFLTRLALYKNQLIYPTCNESVRTPLRQQISESCCGSPTVQCGIYEYYTNLVGDYDGYFSNCVLAMNLYIFTTS
jgi:phage-related protein